MSPRLSDSAALQIVEIDSKIELYNKLIQQLNEELDELIEQKRYIYEIDINANKQTDDNINRF